MRRLILFARAMLSAVRGCLHTLKLLVAFFAQQAGLKVHKHLILNVPQLHLRSHSNYEPRVLSGTEPDILFRS